MGAAIFDLWFLINSLLLEKPQIQDGRGHVLPVQNSAIFSTGVAN